MRVLVCLLPFVKDKIEEEQRSKENPVIVIKQGCTRERKRKGRFGNLQVGPLRPPGHAGIAVPKDEKYRTITVIT